MYKLFKVVFCLLYYRYECLRQGVKSVPVRHCNQNDGTLAYYRRSSDCIVFNWYYLATKSTKIKQISKTIRHEVRHLWQSQKYPILVSIMDEEYFSVFYEESYFLWYNPWEEDARTYSKDRIGREDIIKSFISDPYQYVQTFHR